MNKVMNEDRYYEIAKDVGLTRKQAEDLLDDLPEGQTLAEQTAEVVRGACKGRKCNLNLGIEIRGLTYDEALKDIRKDTYNKE
jgi:hypothetical protein